ncbi:MAG: helix-turn-helix domain-containing protein [Firmicutes bacterium]|nr:helix-turn-helix domain-containing protein [Bacillota bacterium]
MEKRIYNVADIADILSISKPKAYELVHRADFPKIMIGRAIRIPIESFNVWLAQEARGTHEERPL